MSLRSRPQPAKTDWGRLGITAAQAGDLVSAKAYLGRAVRTDRQTPVHRFNLAVVHERLGEIEEAVHQLSEALRANPNLADAGRKLSALLGRFTLSDYSRLEPFGLRIAMSIEGVDPQPLANAALARLSGGALGAALADADARGADAAALRLVERRCADLVRDELFLAAMEAGINRSARIEPLLVSLRKAVLTGLDGERFGDKTLQALVIALGRQSALNEFVWPMTEAERTALDALPIDRAALPAGDPEAGRRLMLQAMYRPLEALAAGLETKHCDAIRPKILRDLVAQRLAEAKDEAMRLAHFAATAGPSDATSRRVAAQYEAAPYPRWSSFTAPGAGSIRAALQRFVAAESLSWFDAPFDVLIAGCGTGKQALQSAIGYGPNARITAIDLSARSLAYAQKKAERLGIANVTFRRADILDLGAEAVRYKVIECVGVLHHMADPFEGWRRLIGLLQPGGLMYLGLYSAIARQELSALRQSAGYPGPGCSDEAARDYRHSLMTGSGSELTARLAASKDLYSLSEFRDLVLHQSETPMRLPQIAEFLGSNKLDFRGFTIDPSALARYGERYPGEPPPGTLAHWHAMEEQEPHLFDSMYRFWCERRP